MTTSRYQYENVADEARAREEWSPEPLPGGGFFARLGYVCAALLLAAAVLASLNPRFGFHNEVLGFDARRWPWELFTGPHGIVWTMETAWVLALSGAAAVMLVCAFLRPGRIRARLALVTAAVVGTVVLPTAASETDLVPSCVLCFLVAVLLAAAIGNDFSPRPASARRLAWIATAAMAVLLFLPMRVVIDELGEPLPGYYSIGAGAIEAFTNALGSNPHPVGQTPSGEMLYATVWNLAPVFLQQIIWLLTLAVGVFLVLGAGRGWVRYTLVILVAVLLLGPPAVNGWRTVDEERAKLPPDMPFATEEVVLHAARGAGVTLLRLERLALLPLALGLADVLRTARRRSKPGQR